MQAAAAKTVFLRTSLVGAAVCAAVAVALAQRLPASLVLSEAAAVGVVAYPFVRGLTAGNFDPFEPVYAFVAYFAFTMFFRGFLDLQIGSPIVSPRFDIGSADFRALMSWVFLYSTLFLLSLYAGYYSHTSRALADKLPRLPRIRFSGRAVAAAVVLSLAISAPAAWLLHVRIGSAVAEGRFSDATRAGGLSWIAYSLRAAFVAGVIWWSYAIGRRTFVGGVLALTYAAIATVASFAVFPTRGIALFAILALLICTHYLGRRVSVRMLLGTLAFGILVIPVLSVYRYYGLDLNRISSLVASIPSELTLLVQIVVGRSYGADSFALILDGTQRTGFEFGRTFLDALWWFVPRGIWPDKPLTYAITFGQQFVGPSNVFSANVSASPTVVGDWYLNFGVVGVLLGGALTGVLFRAIYRYLTEGERTMPGIVLYAFCLSGFVRLVEGPVFDQTLETVVNVGLAAVLFVVMATVARVGRNRATPETGEL